MTGISNQQDIDEKQRELNKEQEEELLNYQPELRYYLSAFDFAWHQLEDAVQDTFVAAWTNINQLKNPESFRNWLFAIARNVGSKYVKRENKVKTHATSFEEQLENLRVEEEKEKSGGYSYIQQFTELEILEALGKLSEREERVLRLYYIYGYNLKEISQITGETYSNTRTIASRAKHKLQLYLQEEHEDLFE